MARKMKDSGIEWIGEIPERWEIVPVRSCFDEVRTKNTNGQEQNALQFKSGNIISKTNFNASMDDYVADTITNYTVVLPDTVMINGLNLNYDFKSLRVALVKEKGVITSAYLAIFPDRKKISPQYATYLFKGYETKMAFHNMGAGIRKTLGYKEFKNQPLLLPSEKEQNKISAYLDSKCSHIDIMLSKIRSSIEEYKKLKQAVITQAVTKGVRGKREMKDSGVEWIGEIPAEWSIAKAKYYVTITHGSDPKTEGSIPVYGSGAESFKTCGEYKEGPTVLIGRKGATLHIPHYIEGKYWNVDTAFDVKAKNNFSLPYYYYLATSFDYKFYIAQTTLPGMTQSNYYNMFLPLPTFPEQEEIVNYLDAKCAEIDGLIAKKEQLVRELESYKKSLIYEVVTGKREV